MSVKLFVWSFLVFSFAAHAQSYNSASARTHCKPVENLDFEGRKTPTLINDLIRDGKNLGRVYVTNLVGDCVLTPPPVMVAGPGGTQSGSANSKKAATKIFLRDPQAIKTHVLEQILGNHFDAIEVVSAVSGPDPAQGVVVTYSARTSTATQESWWFELRETIVVTVTENALDVKISSNNYGTQHDIVGHGLGSGSVRALESGFSVQENSGLLYARVTSLSVAAIQGTAGNLVFKFRHTGIEQKTKSKFEMKMAEIFSRFTLQVEGLSDLHLNSDLN